MKFFKKLLDFKKPTIINLDYLDIVLEDKRLFLLSWHFTRQYKLSIPSLKKKWNRQSGSVVFKIYNLNKPFKIVIASFLRKKIIIVNLKQLKLDPKTSASLIHQFYPFSMPTSLIKEVKLNIAKPEIITPNEIHNKYSHIVVHPFDVIIKDQNFNYHQ